MLLINLQNPSIKHCSNIFIKHFLSEKLKFYRHFQAQLTRYLSALIYSYDTVWKISITFNNRNVTSTKTLNKPNRTNNRLQNRIRNWIFFHYQTIFSNRHENIASSAHFWARKIKVAEDELTIIYVCTMNRWAVMDSFTYEALRTY